MSVLITTTDNWIDRLLLLDLLTTGEIAQRLLADSFRAVGFNTTQARICLLLLDQVEKSEVGCAGLTLKEMSGDLVCAPSKLHPQLVQLQKKKVVSRVNPPPDESDMRKHFYRLTTVGNTRARVLQKHVNAINGAFIQKTSDKKIKYFLGFIEINARIRNLWLGDPSK